MMKYKGNLIIIIASIMLTILYYLCYLIIDQENSTAMHSYETYPETIHFKELDVGHDHQYNLTLS